MKATPVLILFIGISVLLFAQGDCRGHSARNHHHRRGSRRSRQTCISREQKVKYQKDMAPHIRCDKPKKTLVTLDTPDGFEWIQPSVVYVTRCDGHRCANHGSQCVPTNFTIDTYQVEGKQINGVNLACDKVEVRVDYDCACDCITSELDCTVNERYNEELCRCQCRDELREKCLRRMNELPNMFMWDAKTCSCPCNNKLECSTGTTWIPEYCRCGVVSD